ncbi:MAG TPA: o-succinylbenzoate synthase [Terriglobales bacterium]|nr:o-succinylbenzoate synthase [Terriglobales bacterium]
MKIEAITLREIRMPLVHFFETSFSRTTERRIALVTLHCQGLDAWGECVAGEHPFYNEESIDTAWYVISKYLAPALAGKEIARGADAPAVFARVRANRMAKAALENALWDAEARIRKMPLWKLLGGTQSAIACGVSIGIQDTVEHLLDKVAGELAAGYRRIKLKVKPGWDVNILEKVRARWPKVLLSCDANSAYTLADADHLKKFDQFKLLMIEQPLWNDDFYFHSRLQKQLQTAICLDEAIRNARDAEAAIEAGACRIVNIKVGRVGGFSEAIAVHDVAQKAQVPVWCGGMLESGIGRAHNVALSTLPNFTLPGDVSASKRYWKDDIIEPPVTVSPEGFIAVSNEAGAGYAIRTDLIEKLTVRKETIRPAAAVSG